MSKIEFTEAQIMRMQPGDVLALHVPQRLSDEEYHWIREMLKYQLPDGIKTMILEPGMSVEIIRQAKDNGEEDNRTPGGII